jgi:hypothetical protein
VFENRVLRRMFVPKREEERGDWRRLVNEELHNLLASTSTVKTRYGKGKFVPVLN